MKKRKSSGKGYNPLDSLTEEQKAMFNQEYLDKHKPKTEKEIGQESVAHLGINAAWNKGETGVTNRNNSI